jgi:drug/metabolite transporter (DMT)-like permease
MAAMSTQQTPWRAYAALFVGLVILGFSPVLVRAAQAPGVVVGIYRVGIGALVLTIPFIQQLRAGVRIPRRVFWISALAGVFFGADVAAWTSGIVISGATIPTLLANTAPLWVGLGAWLIFKEQLTARFWLGLALAMLGAVLVLVFGLGGVITLDQGALLGALAGVFYGAYFLATQRARAELPLIPFFWVAAVFSALTMLVILLFLGQSLTGYNPATYVNFLVQGVVIQAGGWMLISYAQGHLPASLVSPTLLGQPVITALLAGPILGEVLRRTDLIGGATVLAGILLVHTSRRQRKEKVVPPA